MIRAGEEQIRQMMSAIFFQVLVLALVPFTYMCAQILIQITTSASAAAVAYVQCLDH